MTVERRETRNILKGNGNARAFPFTFQMPVEISSSGPGGEDEIWIAAHDSSPADQAAADYVLDGINDGSMICDIVAQEILFTKFRFYPGTYILDSLVQFLGDMREDPIHLIGSGDDTLFVVADDYWESTMFYFAQIGGSIQNVQIDTSNMAGYERHKAVEINMDAIGGSFLLENVTIIGNVYSRMNGDPETHYTLTINNCRIFGGVTSEIATPV